MEKEEQRTGTAYGFFYYKGKSEDIRKVLPNIREKARISYTTTLDLVEGVENLDTSGDSALTQMVQQAKRQHMSHVIKAASPNEGNQRTASYLGDVMNGIYTELYQKKEPFYAGIIYKRGDKYVFRRE